MRINMPCRTKRTTKKTPTFSTEEIKKQLEQSTKKLDARIRKIEFKERSRKPDCKKR